MLLGKIAVWAASAAWLASSAVYADAACDAGFVQKFHDCVRIVDSLRPDKGGQMRVFAADGSEFTAGQAHWMRGQLKLVGDACSRGDQAQATRLLDGVQGLIRSHQKSS